MVEVLVIDDPYEVLGVDPAADVEVLTEARRQLAKQLHPDLGGDAAAMQLVNQAFDEAVRRLDLPPEQRSVTEVEVPQPAPEPESSRRRVWRPRWTEPVAPPPRTVQFDWPSFTFAVLPAEAFEVLLLAGGTLGQVLVDDPPYLLEVLFNDPVPCWCRLDMVPDAGGTTVNITVAGIDGEPAPDPEFIRDLWIAAVDELTG